MTAPALCIADVITADWLIPAEVGVNVLRLGVAAVLGGLIGLEREVRGRSAGLRTQMLVAVGAALAMIVSLRFATVFGTTVETNLRIDPARVAYGVMGGIGFLGAGVIMRLGFGVRGLTTAASLWCTAAVGLACGFGMYATAGAAVALALFALKVLRVLDDRLPHHYVKQLTIETPRSPSDASASVRETLANRGIRVMDMALKRRTADATVSLTFTIRLKSYAQLVSLIELTEQTEDFIRLKIE